MAISVGDQFAIKDQIAKVLRENNINSGKIYVVLDNSSFEVYFDDCVFEQIGEDNYCCNSNCECICGKCGCDSIDSENDTLVEKISSLEDEISRKNNIIDSLEDRVSELETAVEKSE